MDFDKVLIELQKNSELDYEETVRILVKIIDNILQNPNNPKVRSLQKSNQTVQKKLLSMNGGRECLALIGFKENETGYNLPQDTSVDHLTKVKNSLLVIKNHKLHVPSEPQARPEKSDNENEDLDGIKRFVLPPFKPYSKRPLSALLWISWAIMKVSEMLHVAIACHLASREAELVGKNVHKVLINPVDNEIEEKLLVFSQQVLQNNFKFSLCGLFNIEGSMLFNIIGASTTYIVIMIQFQEAVTPKFTNEFLRRVELLFHEALAFDDKECQKRAKNLIPLPELEEKAQTNLRAIQERIKFEKLPDPEYTMQDVLLLELLEWFKNDFFTWVDKPPCDSCSGPTEFHEVVTNTDEAAFAQRVEIYKCNSCNSQTKFPRYNDLNLLLETRRGRCGEWAQVFTLFCRSLGWDARYIVDELDHVWTEVYSIGQKRWLHCDSCENACDTPLMYEHGWGKQLNYVIGYSPEEVQDVTWRYSGNHKGVLERRHKCTEGELVNALMVLRGERQQHFTRQKQNYLTARLVKELCEFMGEKQVSDGELQGRMSGSMEWRQARGETNETKFVWVISDDNIIDNRITLKYSTAQNCYYFIRGDGSFKKIDDWTEGIFTSTSIFRKVEKDWKQVYLARNEGAGEGTISWRFQLGADSSKVFNKITIKFQDKTYESGLVAVSLVTDFSTYEVSKNFEQTLIINGSRSLEIVANLSGGKGNVAWQHAQIFRQTTDSQEFPFVVSLYFH